MNREEIRIFRIFCFIMNRAVAKIKVQMATSTLSSKSSAYLNDPLDSLANAIGSSLANRGAGRESGKFRKPTSRMRAQFDTAQIKTALREVLTEASPQGRSTRMLLIRHLVDIEAKSVGLEAYVAAKASSDLISTAEAAEILGFSRPYVAMLIDQQKLRGATISAGGHRRVPRASVLEWAQLNQENHKPNEVLTSLRAEGKRAGVYKSSEAAVVRRIKALVRD
jgi:excisionase family DNA binding protein